MEYITAFVIGGLICAVVQILLDRTKLMPGRVMVLLVCMGALLGFCGIYKPFQEFAGSGASVPLLGFGNVLWQGGERSSGPERVHRDLHGRLQSRGCGDIGSPDLRIYRILYL